MEAIRKIELGSDAEEFGDEAGLCDRILLGYPSHSAFRIISTASIPCKVRHAVANEPYPFASQVRFFTVLWSRSTTFVEIFALTQTHATGQNAFPF